MRYNQLFISVLVVLFLTSCVLIKERRNHKKHKNIEYETVYKDETEKLDFESTSRVSDSNEIWYHPNPWWRIKSEPFPMSKDSFDIRRYGPQYGFSKYINPISTTIENDTWSKWVSKNHWDSYGNAVVHDWQSFITNKKSEFSEHPEYLAEKDGKRLGYGKTSKLCVSNPNVQKLYIQYTKEKIKKNPNLKIYSVEPSDGGGFCTCKACTKIGSISNQVFFMANAVAKGIKTEYPDKQVGVLAYNEHSEVPSFKIENNVKVIIVPNGFQTIYTHLGSITSWSQKHTNIGIYEYFGIPQWTGDLPRIPVKSILEKLDFIKKAGGNMIIYEAGTNINAAILASLFNFIIMNPSLTWDEVYEKFLDDCFANSKVPINRMLSRWYSYGKLGAQELNYSLYDLNEASKLTKDKNEIQRIRDLKAYVNYLIIYDEWINIRTTKDSLNATKGFFDYIYNSSNRNIINVTALTQIWAKYISNESLSNRFKYTQIEKKTWIKYMTDAEIDKLFEANYKKYNPKKSDYKTIYDYNTILKSQKNLRNLNNYQVNISNNTSINVYVSSKSITLTPEYKSSDSKTLLSIQGLDNNFFSQQFVESNQSWSVNIPENGIYIIGQNRVSSTLVKMEGSFIPLISTVTKSDESNYNLSKIGTDKKIISTNSKAPISDSAPFYLLEAKD
ncbi:MAG: DUF4838 domain-containing protein [Chitinophagales bacterium]|nr:DUF4838 domain-containing protein [Chitinophagales bacterium]